MTSHAAGAAMIRTPMSSSWSDRRRRRRRVEVETYRAPSWPPCALACRPLGSFSEAAARLRVCLASRFASRRDRRCDRRVASGTSDSTTIDGDVPPPARLARRSSARPKAACSSSSTRRWHVADRRVGAVARGRSRRRSLAHPLVLESDERTSLRSSTPVASATRARTSSMTARTSCGRAAVGCLDEVGVLLRHPRRADAKPAQPELVDEQPGADLARDRD